MPASPHIIAALRRHIAAPLCSQGQVLPFGDPAIDAHLPGGGLPIGQLHELGAQGIEAETGAVCAAFAAILAGALLRKAGTAQADASRILLWIATRCDLYAPGLLQYGLDPGRLILVRATDDEQALQAMETALRSAAPLAVVAEIGKLTPLAARRLQLACLNSGSTGFLLRRWPHGRKQARPEANAAVTRWRLRPAPSGTSRGQEAPPSWQVDLLHARGGRPGAWILQHQPRIQEDAEPPYPLRVVAVLGDHTSAPLPQHERRLA